MRSEHLQEFFYWSFPLDDIPSGENNLTVAFNVSFGFIRNCFDTISDRNLKSYKHLPLADVMTAPAFIAGILIGMFYERSRRGKHPPPQ
jgi:hypothetical protein